MYRWGEKPEPDWQLLTSFMVNYMGSPAGAEAIVGCRFYWCGISCPSCLECKENDDIDFWVRPFIASKQKTTLDYLLFVFLAAAKHLRGHFAHFLCSLSRLFTSDEKLSLSFFYYKGPYFVCPHFSQWPSIISADIKKIKLKGVTDDKCWPFNLPQFTASSIFIPDHWGLKCCINGRGAVQHHESTGLYIQEFLFFILPSVIKKQHQ